MAKIRDLENKSTSFHKSLMVMDAFKFHFMDFVAAAMLIGCTSVVKILHDVQLTYSLHACVKKPFKSILR